MAGDFNKPALTDGYTLFASAVRDLCADIAKGLDPSLTLGTTNYPNKTIRWNGTNNNWERYDTTLGWQVLASTYAINSATATKWATARTISLTTDGTGTSGSFDGSGNATIPLTLATVNSNVGSFGSTSAVPVITVNGKGLVTAVSTAALASMATQASTNVSISGGAISGTTLTLKQSTTAAPTLEGVVEWDTDNDTLVIGTGDGLTAVFSHNTSTATLQNKTLSTGCVWNGTAVPVLYGGTGATTGAGARTNLGIGTIATQNSNAVSITGGDISATNINLVGSVSAAPTAEGRIEWDTDNDLLMMGTGASTLIFSPNTPGAVQTQTNRTFTTGCTWNGTVVGPTYGGTGFSSFAVGDLLYANTTSTLAKLTAGAAGYALVSGGAGVAPGWGSLDLGGSTITGTTPISKGGTGATDAATARANLVVPSTTGGGASGTWGISISGNAATSSSCSGNAATSSSCSGNAATSSSCSGNAATATTATNLSGGTITTVASTWNIGSTYTASTQIMGNSTYAAGLSFHRSGAYAINFGLDYDNVVRLGGWSQGASSWRLQIDGSGNLTATGNVTAYSDERLKKNWKDLPIDTLQKLAEVKVGTYERIDTEGVVQVGVSAQSLQKVMPEAITEQADGILGVSYGNAALAACVLLAKEVVALRAEIEVLKSAI